MWGWVKALLNLLRRSTVDQEPLVEEDEKEEPLVEKEELPVADANYRPGVGTPPNAWMAGDPFDSEISTALAELEDFITTSGVPKKYWSALEICRLPKGQSYVGSHPGHRAVSHKAVAIPPRELWPNILGTLELFIVLRERIGAPCALRGYRPPDYNEVVGGSPKSRHMWFAALDIYPPVGKNKLLGLEGARLYNEYSDVGFGAYGQPLTSNIHIDTGSRKRRWREAQHYIDLLKTV